MVGAPAPVGYGPSVLVGIDHALIACADPDASGDVLERAIGLRASGGGRHDAHGTFNRLFWLGDSYIELMGVFEDALGLSSLDRSGRGARHLRFRWTATGLHEPRSLR